MGVSVEIESQMWFRVKEHFSVEISPGLSSCGESEVRPGLTDLPDEVLLAVFLLLPPRDLISLESCCRRLRSVLVYYNTYKHRLDRILRSKRLNNYMLLSEKSAGKKSYQELSQYYKYRLYKYVYSLTGRSKLKPIPASD